MLSIEKWFKPSAHYKNKNYTLVNVYFNISTGTFTFPKDFRSYYEIVCFFCVWPTDNNTLRPLRKSRYSPRKFWL